MLIASIQAQFESEAIAAKILFADLAKVELYIAESYRSRAFIELLQNADDACAGKFIVRQVGDKLLIANNGRPFSAEDIMALCRSGASNKRRNSGTIGYRGIGFKSVAGIATEIDVVSGEHAFRFSKMLTRQSVSVEHDVPLIRIPHPLSAIDPSYKLAEELRRAEGMTSVFVLAGLNHRMVGIEAQNFDETALLFLNAIRQIDIDLPDLSRVLKRISGPGRAGYRIEQIGLDSKNSHAWLVAETPTGAEKIAFAFDGERIVPADQEQSVIHAFMPTSEFAGARLKINGDFSTDPSRKAVDLDDLSVAALDSILDLLANMAREAIHSTSLPGFFSPFVATTPQDGRFRKLARDGLSTRLASNGLKLGGPGGTVQDVRLAPEWLPYVDYESLCRARAHLPLGVITSYPEIADFLHWLGARHLTIEEVIDLMQVEDISPLGCAQVITRIARQFRFDLSAEKLERLMATRLLPVQNGRVTPREYSGQVLAGEFLEYFSVAAEKDDVRLLFKRLGVPADTLGVVPNAVIVLSPQRAIQSSTIDSPVPGPMFKSPPAIKQWRSAEQNALAWLSALTEVLSVKDVSQANVGYDLEVLLRDGRRKHVEVKSVTRFGDPVRLTNNEHATGFQLGASYLLAFVVNGGDQFGIRFIVDPIRTLALEKRCEQWSWYCEQYTDQLTEF